MEANISAVDTNNINRPPKSQDNVGSDLNININKVIQDNLPTNIGNDETKAGSLIEGRSITSDDLTGSLLPVTDKSRAGFDQDSSDKDCKPIIVSSIREPNCSCLLVHSRIKNKPCDLALDTGSPVSIMSDTFFDTLGIDQANLKPTKVALNTADGKSLEIKGVLNVEVSLGCRVFEIDFVIANLSGISGLLGSNFFEQHKVEISYSKRTLKISDFSIKLSKNSSDRCARIKMVKTKTVPPNSELFVEAYVEGECPGGQCLVEPTKLIDAKGLMMARSLIDPGKGNVFVPVLNLLEKSVTIVGDSVIGNVHPVVEVNTVNSIKVVENSKSDSFPPHLEIMVENLKPELNDKQIDELKQVICEYQDVFVGPDGQLGRTHLTEHPIDTGDAKPIKLPPRRVPLGLREEVDEEINKLLDLNVIEPSDSPWSSPATLVRKKDQSLRFCVDFRKVNDVTRKDAYPIPRIDETLESLAYSRFYCTLDCASGYWQVPVVESDKPKTSFSTHRGAFYFNTMPMGMSNSGATFERLMDKVLKNLLWKQCLCYLDDIVVFGSDFNTTMVNLGAVLKQLREANLKLKPKKCVLFRRQISFLGHVVSENGIECDPEKVNAVRNWPSPTSKTQVKSWLGFVGYYRKFIDNFAGIAEPLTKLTKKNVRFVWSEVCERAFEALKTSVMNAPVLSFPDDKGEFILDCDASGTSVGAVLSQIQNDKEKPIAFGSKTLNVAERNYCTTKRELLSVVTFTKKYKHFLLGRKFVVRTDHAPLVWLKTFKDVEGILARWLSFLEMYEMTVVHRPGTKHANADGMSRIPIRRCGYDLCTECYPDGVGCNNSPDRERDDVGVPVGLLWKPIGEMSLQFQDTPLMGNDPSKLLDHVSLSDLDNQIQKSIVDTNAPITIENTILSDNTLDQGIANNENQLNLTDHENEIGSFSNWLPVWSSKEISEMQLNDPYIGPVLKLKLELNIKPLSTEIKHLNREAKALISQWDSLKIENSVLFRVKKNKQLIAPKPIKDVVFEHLHSNKIGGHLGRDRTIGSVSRRFYWPGMSKQIKRWCRGCDICAQVKPGPGLGRSPLRQFVVNAPMQCVAIDISGPWPISVNQNEYIIVVGDYFTKWHEAYPCRDHTALTVADELVSKFFSRFGCPDQIHSDQGREFESILFSEVCNKLGIKKTRTVPYRPQSDGLVERFNRTLKQMLKSFVDKNKSDWDDLLPYMLMAYRSTEHASTGFTPNMLMLGREVSYPIDLMAGPPPDNKNNVCPVQYVEWLQATLSNTFDFVNENLHLSALRQKSHYDTKIKHREYEPGDWVWRWYPPSAGKKLEFGWTGPYLIIDKLSDLTYEIQKEENSRLFSVHVDHLKPYEGTSQPETWLGKEENGNNDETTSSSVPTSSSSESEDLPAAVYTRRGRKVVPVNRYSP